MTAAAAAAAKATAVITFAALKRATAKGLGTAKVIAANLHCRRRRRD